MDRPIEAPPLRWFLGDAEQRRLASRYWIQDTLEGLGRTALHHAMRLASTDLCSALGAQAGERSRAGFPVADRLAHDNWARLRPQDASRAAAVTAAAFRQSGRLHSEFSILNRLQREGRITIEGGERIAAAQAAGRPVLIAGLHLSNWEIIGPALAQLGHKVTAVYQQPPNRFDHRIVVNSRQRWGCELLSPNAAGARPAVRTLTERNRVLVLYVDECIGEHVYAPFFGRKLKLEGNIVRAVRLAGLTGAVVIPCYVTRGEGAFFHTVFMPPVDLAGGANELAADVARLNAMIEPVVIEHLDQWFWLFDLRLND